MTDSLVRRAMDRVRDEKGSREFYAEPDPTRHPNPCGDVPGWVENPHREDYHCAFRDEAQLLQWFDSEAVRVAMDALGGVLKVFEVADELVLHGTFQVMFKKASAVLVETRRIPTMAALAA